MPREYILEKWEEYRATFRVQEIDMMTPEMERHIRDAFYSGVIACLALQHIPQEPVYDEAGKYVEELKERVNTLAGQEGE